MFDATERAVGRWRAFCADGTEVGLCTDLRTASRVEALDRLARVTLQRGIWP
jgi:glutamate dehydrogenase (NAD(P)+)